ncbi:TlpA disulfide reductase family protein [Mangrovibacterium lignilyticum]|uniref:TlpA disulfide reductase family protein n=1 Tax=Mangrovibacterium lignilyticum TaxID=2668052 RepID=UPI0013D6133D|nr:TlpA disulfide reductase family protein [Mangrovibacterium lignilyticum]
MKKLVYVLCGLLLLGNFACTPSGYTINGELEGVEDGTKIALVPFAKYDVKPEAETTIEGGKFQFEGTVSEPREYYLVLGDKEDYFQLMIENSSMTLKGEVVTAPGRDGSSEVQRFNDVNVSGSESHDYFKSQMAVREDLNKLFEEKNERYADVQAMYGKARIEKNQARMDSIKNLPAYQDYVEAENAFFAEVGKRYNEVFVANKQTFWGPLMMLNLYSYFTPEVRPTFDAMSEEAKSSYYGKMVAEDLYPANRTGEAVPGFTTTDENGNKITLNDLIKDKKLILIDFWASWCVPCRKELPNVKASYEKYASKGFEVLSFSIDKNKDAWLNAVEEEGLEWPNFNDLDVSTLYKVKSVPTTYLIDNQGRLLADNVRGEELGKKLEEILGN